jgi:hypothetical protein
VLIRTPSARERGKDHGDGFLAGVDEVGVDFVLVAEHAVLTLENDIDRAALEQRGPPSARA